MELSEIVECYSSKMAQIHLYQRAMKEIAKKELENLYKYEQSLEKSPEMKEFAHSLHNMDFEKRRTAHMYFLGRKSYL